MAAPGAFDARYEFSAPQWHDFTSHGDGERDGSDGWFATKAADPPRAGAQPGAPLPHGDENAGPGHANKTDGAAAKKAGRAGRGTRAVRELVTAPLSPQATHPPVLPNAPVVPAAVAVTPAASGRGKRGRKEDGAAATVAKHLKLTVPVSPLLATAQRGTVTRSRTAGAAAGGEGGGGSPFVPLAERLFKLEHRTPPRFKAPPVPLFPGTVAGAAPTPKGLTRAASPVLATSARVRGAKAKSAKELEEEWMAALTPFKALPLPSATIAGAAPAMAPHHTHHVTQAQPFELATEKRGARKSRVAAAEEEDCKAGLAGAGVSLQAAWTPKRTVPVAPALATERRSRRRTTDGGDLPHGGGAAPGAPGSGVTPFKARPVPSSLANPWLPDPSTVKPLTASQPFDLATDARGQAYMRQLEARLADQEATAAAARKLSARPVPPGMVVPQAPPGALLPGDGLHTAAVASLQRRREETERLLKQQREGFKARPVPKAAPFVPELSGGELTKPADPGLASDARAARRAAFDAANEARIAAEQAAAAAADARRAAAEAAALARARAIDMVPKAKPMPDFSAAFKPETSKRPLTEPHSPLLGNKRRRCAGPAAPPPQAPRPTEEDAPADYKPKTVTLGDIASLWVTNIAQTYGNAKNADNAPVAEGVLDDLVGRPLFLALQDYFRQRGGVYKLAFGPKVFYVVSCPVVAKHILRTAALRFDKGVLAEILEPIMGKGLIPADYATWQTRRRALVPAFHAAWLSHMVGLFDHCCAPLLAALDGAAASPGTAIDMEALFCSVSLDIIGLSVFNYGFGSVTQESPVIQAVYRVLREAEHRSTFYFPYWNIPGASYLVPRQIMFRQDMEAINGTLNQLIAAAQATAQSTDLADLEARDYSRVKDPSLLRFLVDLRGESATNAQLRDDLMTMLIAGHETTAAVLTWALFQLSQHPECVAELRAELDAVLPAAGEKVTYDHVRRMHLTRLCVAESLRLYPQPPLLIRRALETVELPQGTAAAAVTLPPGADVFIAVYNIHRSSAFWGPDADEWRPKRFLEALAPAADDAGGWAGRAPYSPPASGDAGDRSPLYPTETGADFAYMPFGGGSRKCIGDQFATMEATVVLARIVHAYDFELVGPPGDVGMVTGATIHTEKGLRMRVTKRR